MMATAIRVLFVDDEPGMLDIGKLFLERSGDFAVTTATSAPDAIRLLEQERFDVIVSDYQMSPLLQDLLPKKGSIPGDERGSRETDKKTYMIPSVTQAYSSLKTARSRFHIKMGCHYEVIA